MGMVRAGFDDLDLAWLQAKPGAKWHRHGPGRLAAWVADMDFPPRRRWPPPCTRSWMPATWAIPTGSRARRCDPSSRSAWPDASAGPPRRTRCGSCPTSCRACRSPCTWPRHQALDRSPHPCVPTVLPHGGHDGPAHPPHPRSARRRLGLRPRAVRRDLAAARGACRTLLLCNPQNPTGRVFSRDELAELAALAEEHDLLIISDEIHADLVYEPARHVPIASLGPEVAARTLTLTSATKAFNLAGVRCAVAHIGPRRSAKGGMRSRTTCSASSAAWGWRPPAPPGRTVTTGWRRWWPCSTATDGFSAASWPPASRPSITCSRRPPIWRGWTSGASASPTVPRRCCATAASCSTPAPTSVPTVKGRAVQLRHQRRGAGGDRRPHGRSRLACPPIE